ncbi:MAG: peptidase M14 [Gemmatimonadetes bacterium]|nr:peptidase M14 [Gemmatimonadota bacterium]
MQFRCVTFHSTFPRCFSARPGAAERDIRRRSRLAAAFALLAVTACRAVSTTPSGVAPSEPCCLDLGRRIATEQRVGAIENRRFNHAQYWVALAPSLRSKALRTTPVGASTHGRALRAITFGSGPTTVFLWSQMHGDESTATMALADLLGWFALADGQRDAARDRIASQLTVVMLPMLNPDGAELFQRENAVGVDINRDVRRMSTAEARVLKAVRDSINPQFGFNLHDQNARTLGRPGNQRVGIALLAPAADVTNSFGPVRSDARLVAARIRAVLEREIPGRIARYDDTFNPRAFGDLMQAWGTRTVLIESGALPEDADKQRLRRVNVIAILSALNAIATGDFKNESADTYTSMPVNSGSAVDVVIRGASLVIPGQPPVRVDLSFNYDDALRQGRARVREIGDLDEVVAFDTVSAAGLFMHPAPAMLAEQGGKRWLRTGTTVQMTLRRGQDATSEVVREFGAKP